MMDDISRKFYFSKILIFWVKKSGKGKEGHKQPVMLCASFLGNCKPYEYGLWRVTE